MNDIVTYIEATGIWGILSLLIVILMAFFTIRDFIRFKKKRNQQVKQWKSLEDQKCKGPHSWMDMEIFGETTHVCKDCCFIPKHDTFVKRHFVDAQIKQNEYLKEAEEYRQKRMTEICEKYDIQEALAQSISDEVISIKKDFVIMKLDQALKEMMGDKQ